MIVGGQKSQRGKHPFHALLQISVQLKSLLGREDWHGDVVNVVPTFTSKLPALELSIRELFIFRAVGHSASHGQHSLAVRISSNQYRSKDQIWSLRFCFLRRE